MKASELDEAERLYELARKDDPFHTKWIAGLARVHLRQKETGKFLKDLAMIAANDADDLSVRKALAERHLAQGDAAASEKWAGECLDIDVYDPTVHVLLADAQAAGKKFAEAIEEYQTALELKAKKPNDLKVKLARAQLGRGDRTAAKATLDGILKEDPEHPEAKALREESEHAESR
jgi:Tfp pilus assembly protein PilF